MTKPASSVPLKNILLSLVRILRPVRAQPSPLNLVQIRGRDPRRGQGRAEYGHDKTSLTNVRAALTTVQR